VDENGRILASKVTDGYEAENAFYRYKRIISGRLRAKNEDAQKQEAAIGCAILNRMLEMGESLSYAVG